MAFVLALLLLLSSFAHSIASDGDTDSVFRSCVKECEQTGCVGEICFRACAAPGKATWFLQEPLYLRLKEWDCRSDCRYHCMVEREKERTILGEKPLKYYGRWPFKRIFGFEEPLSVALCVFNLALQFHGWVSFLILVYYKLPLRPVKRTTYYDFTGLLTIYAMFSMNSSLWRSFFHTRRDVELVERLVCCSEVGLEGFSLFLAILITFNVRAEATRVMLAAPLVAFVITHMLYLNFYEFDRDWNMKVSLLMLVVQLLLWTVWAWQTSHPSRYNVWAVAVGAGILHTFPCDVYDFPPIQGYLDSYVLHHAMTIPLTYIWWKFLKEDAIYKTEMITSRAKNQLKSKVQ